MNAPLFARQQPLIRLTGCNQLSVILSRFEKILYMPRAAEEGSANCWAVNDADGRAIFDLPSLHSAQHVAERLKDLGGTVKAIKGGVQ